MNYEVKINGNVIGNVKTGFTLIDRIDDQFDSGTIVQLYNSNSEPIAPRSNVQITIDELEYNYIVNVDNVEQVSFEPELYQHALNLISIEKKYDYEIIPALTFTNKTDGTGYTYAEQLERIRRVHPLETKYFHDRTRIIETGLIDDARVYEQAPQLTLNRGTMLQAFSTVLQPLDLIPKIYEGIDLSVKKVNKLNDLVANEKYTNFRKNNNLEYYVGATESQVDNAITNENTEEGTCFFPSKTTWISFRSAAEGQVLATDYFTIPLPDNIYTIKSIKAKVWINNTSPTMEGYYEEELDITDFIYEKEKWNLLDVGNSLTPYKGRTKINCAFYSYNGNSIDGFGEDVKYYLLFKNNRLPFLLGTAYTEQTEFAVPTFDYFKTLFRIEYVPFTKGLVKEYKNAPQLLSGNLNVSSTSAIVDFKRLGRNLKGLVDRIGNGDLTLKFKLKDTSELISVGDYTEDGYIATSCEKQFFDDYIIELVSFTKNFNRISQYMGIDTEYRSYEIPRNGIIRHLHYDDFVVISDNDTVGNANFIQNLNFIYYTLEDTHLVDLSINNALVQTFEQELTPTTFRFDFDQDDEGGSSGGSTSELLEMPYVPYIKMSTGAQGSSFTYVELLIVNHNTFDVNFTVTGTYNFEGTIQAGGQSLSTKESYGNESVTVTFSADGYADSTQTLTHNLADGSTGSSPDQEDAEDETTNYIEGCWSLTHSYSTDKAVCFSFGFNDTVKAGNATGDALDILGISGYTQPAVKYTNDDGRFYYMDFELYQSFALNSNIFAQACSYPRVMSADVLGLTPTISTRGRKLVVDKDPSEIIKMTYQISFVSEVESITIGNAFSDRCKLVAPQDVGGLYLWNRRVGKYAKNETNKVDTEKDYIITLGIESITKVNDQLIRIRVNNNNKCWCLANSNREIYLTCNDPNLTEIYIKTQHYL